MITSNANYAFGGRCSTLQTKGFLATVTTAKDGVFSMQTTIISEGDLTSMPQFALRKLKKIYYNPDIDSEARLKLHDAIVSVLDELGEEGASLRSAIITCEMELNENNCLDTVENAKRIFRGDPPWLDGSFS